MSKQRIWGNKARQMAAGMVIRWTDTSRSMDASGFDLGDITHKNPSRRIYVKQFFVKLFDWIYYQQPLQWQFTVTLFFDYPNGVRQSESAEISAYCRLAELAPVVEDEFADSLRHGAAERFVYAEFVAECIGINRVHTA